MAEETKRIYTLKVEGTESIRELKDAIDELNQRLKSLGEQSNEYKEGLEKLQELQCKLNDATKELDETLTKEATSLKELRSQINGLKDRLVQLDEGTEEYNETLTVLVSKQSKLSSVMAVTKRDVDASSNSYAALSAQMAALKKQWRETGDEAERARLGQRIAEINAELKKMDASIGNYQRNVGNYTNSIKEAFADPRKEIRELRLELARLEEGTEEYNLTLARLADLTTQQRKLNEQLKYSSSDLGDILGNVAGVASGIAGGFSALNAAMGLFGGASEDVQKAMLKTQQFMALVQGLSQLENLKDKIQGLGDGIKGFVSRFGMVNSSTKEFAENTKVAASEAERATGSLDAQAGAASKLGDTYDRLSSKERNSVSYIDEEIAKRETSIALLEKEIDRLAARAREAANNRDYDGFDSISNEYESKEKELRALREEIDTLKETKKERLDLADARSVENGLIDETIVKLEEEIRKGEETIKINEEEIEKRHELAEQNRVNIELAEKDLEIEQQKEYADQDKIEWLEKEIALNKEELDTNENLLAAAEREVGIAREKQAQAQKELAAKEQLFQKNQQLNTQLKSYNKMQLLSIASTKLDIANTKALANGKMFLAVATKTASVALKGLKAALISTGIGALLVALGEGINLIGKGLKALFNWIKGTEKHKAALASLNSEIERMNEAMDFNVKVMQARGASAYKVMAKEITNLSKTIEKQTEAVDYAKEHFKEDSDEVKDAVEALEESLKSQSEKSQDAIVEIEKLMADVEKAERQKGMTQLEKDMDDLNTKFSESIALIRTMQDEGLIASSIASNYIQRLTKDWDLAIEQAKAKNASGGTKSNSNNYEKERKEAQKLLEDLEKNGKREEQILREKYEKEKKMLEKFHLDTKKLTEKYNKDMEALLVSRMKTEYDKWVEHLNAVLSLQRSGSIEYMEMEIENLKKIFSADFGQGVESPFESLFDIQILDEAGSKAIAITDDIAESMRMIGLDPSNIDDIQKMIDKWNLDKKAIEDAEKALKEYKSELKFTEYENEGNAIGGYLESRLQEMETLSEAMSTKSLNIFGKDTGFYTGTSPKELQAQFEERYAIMETEIDKEIELWRKAMEDESLSAEDRNKALQRYNEAMAKQGTMMVQKEIEANNLLIKSFQNVSTQISNIASNMASIFASVGDMIMATAERQLEAGEITEEEYNRQFEKQKALQIATATINTIAGAVGAFMGITKDTGGWGIAAAAIEAAAVLAAGFAQIQQIRNTKPSSSAGPSNASASSMAFNLPQVLIPEPQRTQNVTSQNDIDTLMNALNDQRVYVTESDISSALNKANKRKVEVSF